ncbi:hypothetical protein EVAR_78811_1 [Eumeta japonica]|uniref:Uncharacterized protein n=1 Tax=Eumeta variegata TaxID=151549 RepID=A0A4C1T1P8_EUMVA|nr:hypothetical protein EVAR_78811_1 [Eumeta japonica]
MWAGSRSPPARPLGRERKHLLVQRDFPNSEVSPPNPEARGLKPTQPTCCKFLGLHQRGFSISPEQLNPRAAFSLTQKNFGRTNKWTKYITGLIVGESFTSSFRTGHLAKCNEPVQLLLQLTSAKARLMSFVSQTVAGLSQRREEGPSQHCGHHHAHRRQLSRKHSLPERDPPERSRRNSLPEDPRVTGHPPPIPED